MTPMRGKGAPVIAIVGAGFGGLWATRVLAKSDVKVILVDRNNYHTFLPLLYQVGASELGPDQIINPIRSFIRKLPDVRFVMADVARVNLADRMVECSEDAIGYDYLILAPGSTPEFFSIPGAKEIALPLRTLEDGVAVRNHILRCFERASKDPDPERRRRLLTFVIVGGGPTGVEFAGALAELVQGPLKKDFRPWGFREVRLVLLEAMDRLLPGLPSRLSAYALERMKKKGLEVRLMAKVSEMTEEAVHLHDGEVIPAETVVWTAGHRGHPVAEASGLPTNGRGQVSVLPTLQVAEAPDVYVVGDLAAVDGGDRVLPMVAPVAMQQGEHAAKNILRQLEGSTPIPFRYSDRGMMVVLGRNAGAVQLGKHTFTGFPAWILWLFVHLLKLVGFRNRLQVLINWGWDYILYERAVRMIIPTDSRTEATLELSMRGHDYERPREHDGP